MAKSTVQTQSGEITVETGVGFVITYELPAGKRNGRAEIRVVDPPNLQHPLKGSVDTHDAELAQRVAEAHATGQQIAYRIETVRAEGVSPDTPIAEVDRMKKFRRLVRCDPHAPGDAQDASGATNPVPNSPEDHHGPQEPANGHSAPASRARRPRVEEARPWERTNSDGSPNLGSYAYLASLGYVEWAFELLLAHARHEGDADAPTERKVGALAALLLEAADRAQQSVRADGHVDRMDPSHTRARGAVRTAIELHPVPWGAAPEVRQEWVAELAETATMLMVVAARLDR